ncbi:MAG: hypothetical protein HY453_02165 [Parcubacteria group bacterium]|nr:hypothetical protein [Parcubacteria group bacterium]
MTINASIKEAFRDKDARYIGGIGFFAFLAFSVWMVHIQTLRYVLWSSIFPFSSKAKIFFYSLGGFFSNFSFIAQVILVITAFLLSINIAMLVHFFKKRSKLSLSEQGLPREITPTFSATAVSFLGLGCSACGSVILSSMLGIGTSSFISASLPLYGHEFGLISIALLIWSIAILSQKIASPMLCEAKIKTVS